VGGMRVWKGVNVRTKHARTQRCCHHHVVGGSVTQATTRGVALLLQQCSP